MNWLKHPLALAARNYAGRVFGGRLGCLTHEDAQQEGAIRAWRRGDGNGRAVVSDIMRREGSITRDGVQRVDRGSDPLGQLPDQADAAPGPEQLAMQAEALRQAAQRLARMPERHQQVVTGILQGEDFQAIGMRLNPPASPVRVSQMLRQVLIQLDGREPWKTERGGTADTATRPQPHAVRVAHAMQAVRARSRLEAVIDAQRARLQELDMAALSKQAAVGRVMYQQDVGD